MNYGEIKEYDIANGYGVRVSLFVSGCRNHCPGCFQPETWDFDYGKPFTESVERRLIDSLSKPWCEGLSVLGGDPMEPENQTALLPFLKKVKEEFPDKSIWLYTGYLYEDISNAHILKYVDVLVDGPYIESEKDITIPFRGSRNQRIINLKEVRGGF